MPRRAWVSWSSGKDCATALAEVRAEPRFEVTGLLTTVTASDRRVVAHNVPLSWVADQAAALRLPLHVVELPDPCPNEVYEERMQRAASASLADGAGTWVFGDLQLADVRAFRERLLARIGVESLFPLWGRDTTVLARSIIDSGVRAVLVAVDPAQLDASFVGREYDDRLLADLPAGVDPCGENGEFHTFVCDGPGFAERVARGPGQEGDGTGGVGRYPVG